MFVVSILRVRNIANLNHYNSTKKLKDLYIEKYIYNVYIENLKSTTIYFIST